MLTTLSRFSESSSCWYLRVTLTPESPRVLALMERLGYDTKRTYT